MVKKFELGSNSSKTELDINGNVFYVDSTDPEVLDRIMSFGKEAIELSEKMGGDDYTGELREAIALNLGMIDAVLGKGAADKIFKGKSVSLMDSLQVTKFITDSIIEGRDEELEKFVKYSPKRAKK